MNSKTSYLASSVAAVLFACSPHGEDEVPSESIKVPLVNASRDNSGEYPYVTQVVGSETCSGTVINCRHVLTAGHCVAREQPMFRGGAVLNARAIKDRARIRIVQQPSDSPMYFTGTSIAHPAFRMTLDKRPGDRNDAKTVIYTRADLAIVTLDPEQQIPPWIVPIDPSAIAPTNLEELTLVGYGYSSCKSNVGAGVRRWGPAIVDATDLGDSFPDLFRLTKRVTDEESVVVQPGDSGGPALRGAAGLMTLVGVASSSTCDSNQRFNPSSVFGESFYTNVNAYDSWVTQETYRDWILAQTSEICDNQIDDDCNGKTDCEDPSCATQSPCCGGLDQRCCQGNLCTDASTICSPVDNTCVVVEKTNVGTTLAVGDYHACARKTDGSLWCWGANGFGQLGDGTSGTNESLPTQVTTLDQGVSTVSAGGQHSCATVNDGSLWCWGWNQYGQLGDGSTNSASIPVRVSALGTDVKEVSTGWMFTCARNSGGTVWCWGMNDSGQLGNGTVGGYDSTPAQVAGLPAGITALAAGMDFACALTASGGVWCWGNNSYGKLGSSSGNSDPTPRFVAGVGSDVVQIAAGAGFAMARKSNGTLWFWGGNTYGEAGFGTAGGTYSPLSIDSFGTTIGVVDAGSYHACARLAGGSLSCWGHDIFGEIGDGTLGGIGKAPYTVTSLSADVIDVSAGYGGTCARLSDGTIWCWGMSGSGQLGNGSLSGLPCGIYFCTPTPTKVLLEGT